MHSIRRFEKHLELELAYKEKVHKLVYGLHANEYTKSPFKSATIVSATNQRLYITTLIDEDFYSEVIHYANIQAVFHRQRVLSGLELIFFANNKRYSISHIEEGCPIELMHYIHSKMGNPFSTTA